MQRQNLENLQVHRKDEKLHNIANIVENEDEIIHTIKHTINEAAHEVIRNL